MWTHESIFMQFPYGGTSFKLKYMTTRTSHIHPLVLITSPTTGCKYTTVRCMWCQMFMEIHVWQYIAYTVTSARFHTNNNNIYLKNYHWLFTVRFSIYFNNNIHYIINYVCYLVNRKNLAAVCSSTLLQTYIAEVDFSLFSFYSDTKHRRGEAGLDMKHNYLLPRGHFQKTFVF